MMIDRRHLLMGAAALTATACASVPGSASTGSDAFVSVDGMGFRRNGAPYHYVGTNMWYAAWIGSDGAFGDRGRLTRELDRMQAAGIKNIRLAGSGEDSPLTNSVKPAFRDHSAEYNESLLKGLDVTLAEMARRDMTAVVYLTNFWEWSGGMMTYLYWT
ncbi:MAG: mannanase, partial [Brevundimonas sp.]